MGIPLKNLEDKSDIAVDARLVGFGRESNVYRLSNGHLMKVFNKKIVNGYETFELNAEEKIQNINYIYNCNLSQYFNKPLIAYLVGEKIVAYEFEEFDGGVAIDYLPLKSNNKNILEVLLLCKNALLEAHDSGFLIGDLTTSNILYRELDLTVKYIDVDSFIINSKLPNTINEFAQKYISNGGKVDQALDVYLLNYLTMFCIMRNVPNYYKAIDSLYYGRKTDLPENQNFINVKSGLTQYCKKVIMYYESRFPFENKTEFLIDEIYGKHLDDYISHEKEHIPKLYR